MDIRGLKTFIEAAELGSFTRTGERLGYSQPTVSFQIRQLEQELGVQLFDRIGHTVSLTDAGRDALRYAQRIVLDYQEMSQVTDARREPSGVVRLGMADSLCGPMIAAGFDRFREEFPKVSLNITTGGTTDLLRRLDHNEVDLVCTLDSHVYNTAYVLAAEEKLDVHFVAAANHPLATGEELAIEQLLEYPFLLTEKGVSYGRLLEERMAQYSHQIHPVLELSRTDQLCQLVERGVGISFLPDYVTEEAVQSGRVVRLDVPKLQVEVWKQLFYRRDKWVSLPMRVMIEYLAEMTLSGDAEK